MGNGMRIWIMVIAIVVIGGMTAAGGTGGEGEGDGELLRCEGVGREYTGETECEESGVNDGSCLCSASAGLEQLESIYRGGEWEEIHAVPLVPTAAFSGMGYTGTLRIYSYGDTGFRSEVWSEPIAVCIKHNVPDVDTVFWGDIDNPGRAFDQCGDNFLDWFITEVECGDNIDRCRLISSTIHVVVATGAGAVFDTPLADTPADCSDHWGCWEPPVQHTADVNSNWTIELTELLRVIQFFNSGGYHCGAGTEDGYAPGQGATACAKHSSDFHAANWQIELYEVLRLVQFFNSPNGFGYCSYESDDYDGYCVGYGW